MVVHAGDGPSINPAAEDKVDLEGNVQLSNANGAKAVDGATLNTQSNGPASKDSRPRAPGDRSGPNGDQESVPGSASRRPSLTISPGISVSPAVAALPPISPAAQALKQRQEAVDASNAPTPEVTPTSTPPSGPAVIPAFPAPPLATSDTPSSAAPTLHPPTDADSLGYPAPGSLMRGGQAPPVIAIQEPIGEEGGVLRFGKPVAPGGGLLPDDLQDTETLDGESSSGKFDKVDLSDETGYQKGLAMLERGEMPTPDMMSPQEWVAFQQQRSSGLGKKHPTAQPGGGRDQQEGGWFQSVTPYAKEMGRTFGRIATSVENAYKRGERRRDRVMAMVESAQQASAEVAAITPEVFESFWRKHFNAPPEEELEIAYACSLNTEAGPLPGVVYQSNKSIAFSSDKPVAYPTVDGHSEQATYKLVVPWVEVTGIEGLRSQPLVQERYIKVSLKNGDELWFLRFKDYNRGLSGMSDGLKDFRGDLPNSSPGPEADNSKPDSKPPSRSATPPLPPSKTTRSNSRGRENAPPQDENLQETYTARVHEAIEKVRSSSADHLPGLSGSGAATTTVSRLPAAGRSAGESTSGRGRAEGSSVDGGASSSAPSRVPVEKPGGGDILDVGQKEKVELNNASNEPPVKAPGEGDVLDAGSREEVSLPDVNSSEFETVEIDADVVENVSAREVAPESKENEESAKETR
ncbi:GRAM domain containing protein [Klebsormidium nitens]|uniref:GRAM domain containing protein n=1 Tax=Klebsormidium nitens TaxID=105231 RepID=A0A1Y1HLA5_KLENI|nr:GRAM domain containing protein [Klebsormidium nitens]|eukprot:GAQ78432.1 GRAM domain containing protein [Klebsormidium nitens]